jgi:hypothetical protein
VHAADEPVDGLRRADELPRLLFACLPRIRERVEIALVLVEIADRGFIADRGDDDVAAFLGLADAPDLDAIRRGVEGVKVLVDVFRVRQLARRTDDLAEDLERRRNRAGRGQMIDQLRRDPRVLQVLLDLLGLLLVDRLRGRLRSGGSVLRNYRG